jgi:group I intron endonuclease
MNKPEGLIRDKVMGKMLKLNKNIKLIQLKNKIVFKNLQSYNYKLRNYSTLTNNKLKVVTEFISIPSSIKSFSNLDKIDTISQIRNSFKSNSVVYGIANNLNSKIYIGSTTNSDKRFFYHFIKGGRSSNKYLQNAIKLIGLSNFTLYIFSVTEFSETMSKKDKRNMILSLEQKYIDMFPKSQLYNFLFEAGSRLGQPHSEETKKLMSINSQGKNLGRNPINKGVKLSKLAKEQLALKRKKLTHRFKPVYFYDEMNNLITIYESFSEARRQEKCRSNTLLSCIKEGKLFKGFKVSY